MANERQLQARTAKKHHYTYMGIELHKVDTESERASEERELALDWIRSQRGEKQGQRGEEGRTPFIRRSIYFESRTEVGEMWNGGALKEGGNKKEENLRFSARPPSFRRRCRRYS